MALTTAGWPQSQRIALLFNRLERDFCPGGFFVIFHVFIENLFLAHKDAQIPFSSNPHFLVDGAGMRADGLQAQAELMSDLGVGEAGMNQQGDLLLAMGKSLPAQAGILDSAGALPGQVEDQGSDEGLREVFVFT